MKHEMTESRRLQAAINRTSRIQRTGPAIVSYWPALRFWALYVAAVWFFGWLVVTATTKAAYDQVNALPL